MTTANPDPTPPTYTVGNSVAMRISGRLVMQRVYPLQIVHDGEIIETVAYIPDATNAWDIAGILNRSELI